MIKTNFSRILKLIIKNIYGAFHKQLKLEIGAEIMKWPLILPKCPFSKINKKI